ncbi:MAG: sigma-70 family RNA polymerase sigma factor [Clostridia bacterium]|nr:sigma-70 family RNA polymerase sigma factor [Clostridia bacterium]
MDDNFIIDLYWSRDEKAISETSEKYGKYCYKIAFNVLSDQGDSEECVNDTYLKAWNSIPPERPSVLSAFLGRITRNLALNRYNYKTAQKRGGGRIESSLEELAECVSGSETPEDVLEGISVGRVINGFIAGLTQRNRNIFVSRYFYLESVSEIAEKYGLTEPAVKTALFRMRQALAVVLKREGAF